MANSIYYVKAANFIIGFIILSIEKCLMIPKIVPPSQTKASGKPYTLDYNYQTIFTPSSLVIKHGSGILPIWFDDSPINTSISGGFPTKNPTSSPCLIGNSSHV